MQWDEVFPIERFSDPIKAAILQEFGGRCPSLEEMACISDRRLLRHPWVNQTTLAVLRVVIRDLSRQTQSGSLAGSTDGELITECDSLL